MKHFCWGLIAMFVLAWPAAYLVAQIVPMPWAVLVCFIIGFPMGIVAAEFDLWLES